mgnify:CR=1 FL=1
MTIVGTRPEIIRLSRVISKLDDCCEHVLVHTGQNYDYELNEIFFADLEIKKPDYFLVLPWHFKEHIIKREQEFLKNGGKLIFPLPDIEII